MRACKVRKWLGGLKEKGRLLQSQSVRQWHVTMTVTQPQLLDDPYADPWSEFYTHC